ncbi:MAG: hypothetical protein R2793_00345 [Flavobacteriaceae bacterium]
MLCRSLGFGGDAKQSISFGGKKYGTGNSKRLFFNTSWWFYSGSRENFKKKKPINPIWPQWLPNTTQLGLSNGEIAALSRSHDNYKVLGAGTRGDETEYLELLKAAGQVTLPTFLKESIPLGPVS